MCPFPGVLFVVVCSGRGKGKVGFGGGICRFEVNPGPVKLFELFIVESDTVRNF